MTRALAYWLLMLLWLVLGLVWHFSLWAPAIFGLALIPFLLFALVGWQVFGRPVQ